MEGRRVKNRTSYECQKEGKLLKRFYIMKEVDFLIAVIR